MLVFDPSTLKELLVHYTEGVVPLNAEVLGFEVNPTLPRYLSLVLRSAEWEDGEQAVGSDGMLTPLNIRYEAKRVLKIESPKDESGWSNPGAVEAPRRQ